jgi:hypothetical protein
MDSKVCFITNFWLGSRRYEYPKYKEDKLYFLKQQIKCLQTYDHNLTKIIFNFNIIPEQYHYISKIFAITPKQIQGAEVEINIRENIGISYGAWSDLFGKYRSEYDYYVFNEDDYFFVQNNWDSYLVNKYNSHSDCGYLCMFIQEPAKWNKFKKHAGSSVGISSTEILTKIWEKYNKLPSISGKQDDVYNGWGDIQLDFGFVFLELGLNIYDVRDDFKIIFQKVSPVNPNVQCWQYFLEHSQYLSVAPFYFENNFDYYCSLDLEFNKDYKPTNNKEALYCYQNQLPYYDDGYDESGKFTGWIRKNYNFDS